MNALETLYRAAYLGGLTALPMLLSPEPTHSSSLLGLFGIAALATPIGLAIKLRRVAQTLESTVAAVAWPITVVALIAIASTYSGTNAPLLRGYYVAAPFVWISLAITAASLAGHFLGTNWKNKRVGAAVVVLGGGVFLFRAAHELIATPAEMWSVVLAQQPSNERAFVEVFSSKKIDRQALAAAADACLAEKPSACACLIGRSDARLRKRDEAGASTDATTALAAHCALDTAVSGVTLRTVLISTLAQAKDWDSAERYLSEAPDEKTSSRLLVADALVKQGRGDAQTAEALARQALDAPDAADADRDAHLLLASLLMARGERTEAKPILLELAKQDPSDSDAAYDLALIDDLAGDFNAAREGYLKVLRQSPEYRAARYNLALLTLRQGSIQEARHHAAKYAEAWPSDPRGPELIRLTGATPGAN